MTEALCSEINHQKYYSGEFDIEWGNTITEHKHTFKRDEMNGFRSWLKENNFDWDDPKLSLGYIKIGQVDLETSFQNRPFLAIYDEMKENLNIKSISIRNTEVKNEFPYTLESEDWKQLQLEGLRQGYESRGMC